MTALLIPLDDRPCCLLFPQRLASLRGLSLSVPPRHLLGSLRRRGDSLHLWRWLERRLGYDICLLSWDMMMWGGLVGSRRPSELAESEIESRLEAALQLRSRAGLFSFGTVMRVAPTQTNQEEVRWANRLLEASQRLASSLSSLASLEELLASANGGASSRELTRLLGDVPLDVWRSYWQNRLLKHRANRRLVEAQLRRGASGSFLLMGYDDCQGQGVNLLEGKELRELIGDSPLAAMSTGTDELAQLLLARALASDTEVGVVWNKPEGASGITRYENCPLTQVLAGQARVAGAKLRDGESAKTMRRQLWIWAPASFPQQESAHQGEGNTAAVKDLAPFFEAMQRAVDSGAKVFVADVAYANGGDKALIAELMRRDLLGRISGYSAWNTAGNTLGTALAIAMLAPQHENSVQKRNRWRFLWERLSDDFFYQSVVRPELSSRWGGSFVYLDEDSCREAEAEIAQRLRRWYDEELRPCFAEVRLPRVDVRLPWRRLFEVEVDCDLSLR